jgi:hypothetical protein
MNTMMPTPMNVCRGVHLKAQHDPTVWRRRLSAASIIIAQSRLNLPRSLSIRLSDLPPPATYWYACTCKLSVDEFSIGCVFSNAATKKEDRALSL